MAEIAIPIVLLGGMYVMSNQNKTAGRGREREREGYARNAGGEKRTEGFVGGLARPAEPGHVPPSHPMPGAGSAKRKETGAAIATSEPSTVAPGLRVCDDRLSDCRTKNINEYESRAAGSSKERFYTKDIYGKEVAANAVGHMKMTGEAITANNFRHKNMVPFFGAKMRGVQPDASVYEGLLDQKQGAGSLQKKKKETASFFKNHEGFSNVHGTQNHNDFYMQRMTPSMKMDHIRPFEPERVGPGLGKDSKDHANEGVGGFNSGMQMRDQWMPRNVDAMRTSGAQKATGLQLDRVGGPVNQPIKRMGEVGRIEKRRPDTHFENTPNMWGAGVNQAALGAVSRDAAGVRTERLINKSFDNGTQLVAGAQPVKATYGERTYLASHRQTGISDHNAELEHMQITRATPSDPAGNDAHLREGVTHKSTYRAVAYDSALESKKTFLGGMSGALKELVSPLVHVIKPTQKESLFADHRNLNSYKQAVQNPEARDFESVQPPTNREILEGVLGMSHAQPNAQNARHQMPSRDANHALKDETNVLHSRVGGAAGQQSSGAADNYHMNKYQTPIDKTVELDRMPSGYNGLFAPTMNARVEKQYPLQEKPRFEAAMGHVAIPSVHTFGVTNSMFSLSEKSTVENRLDAGLLDAFKKNPFTHSLHSAA